MDVYDHRGKRLDDPEDEGPSHCPDCGLYYAEVENGCIDLYDANVDDYRPFPVNSETGCLCRPEDFEPKGPPADLDSLPF